MMVRRGMMWADVVAVRDDFELVSDEYGVQSYEGEASDGGVLCVDVMDGVVVEVVHGAWL